ncbi:MAG: Hsp20/alpha crystallin family protein [Candidatus Heteroscillospira sp.]
MMLPSIFGENLFDDFFSNAFDRDFYGAANPLYGKHAKNLMKTDVHEGKNDYRIAIDLPGFKKDEVNVDLKNGYLTVSAAKGLDKDEESREGHYLRQERYAGACSRSFYVGNLSPDEVKCRYESGVLTLTLPKKDKAALENQNRIMIE